MVLLGSTRPVAVFGYRDLEANAADGSGLAPGVLLRLPQDQVWEVEENIQVRMGKEKH